jgi:two-component system LytT family response regulator
MSKIKVLIVDDEANARTAINGMIKAFIPEAEVVAMVPSIPEAVVAIKKHQPKIIFLDIEMPGYKGTDLLKFFLPEEVDFAIIFVTAYDSYALKAFELSAVDYLLKPTNKELLVKAFERAKKIVGDNLESTSEKVALLNENLSSSGIKKIALSNSSGLNITAIDDIIYLKADGAYTHVVLSTGKKITCSKSLAEFANIESHKDFFRVHRSFCINLNKIVRFSKKDGGFLEMENGDEIPISNDKKTAVIDYLNKITI